MTCFDYDLSHLVLIHFHRKCSLPCRGTTGSQESLGVAMGSSLPSVLFVRILVRISLFTVVVTWQMFVTVKICVFKIYVKIYVSGARKVRIWNRECVLQATSEVVNGLEHPLCWK